MGVTSTGSHLIGTYNFIKVSFECASRTTTSTYLCRRENILDGLRDLRSDTITFNQGDGVVALFIPRLVNLFGFAGGVARKHRETTRVGDHTSEPFCPLNAPTRLPPAAAAYPRAYYELSDVSNAQLRCKTRLDRRHTCENGDAWAGTVRSPRRHWREGAAKARAEIIVTVVEQVKIL